MNCENFSRKVQRAQDNIHTFFSRKWGSRDVLEQGIVVIRLVCKVYSSVHMRWICIGVSIRMNRGGSFRQSQGKMVCNELLPYQENHLLFSV